MSRYWKRAILAAVVAAVLASAVHLVALAFDVSMMAIVPGSEEPQQIPLAVVLFQSVFFTLLGAAVAKLIARFTDRAAGAYTTLAVIVFLLLSISAVVNGQDSGTVVALLLEHFAVLIPTLVLVVPELRYQRPAMPDEPSTPA